MDGGFSGRSGGQNVEVVHRAVMRQSKVNCIGTNINGFVTLRQWRIVVAGLPCYFVLFCFASRRERSREMFP